MPFFRRLPFKRGFTNIHRIRWAEVNIQRLDLFDEGSEITPARLQEAGLIHDARDPVAVLGHGKLTKAFTIQAHRVTSGAQAAIEKAGGNGFRDHSLPEAILKFKQGFGRLVRTSTDRGRVVVLDPRVRTKGYGRAFLAALPEGVLRRDD